MITKDDAIKIAKAIAVAARHDISEYTSPFGIQAAQVPAIRGAAFRAIDEIWYEVLPMSTREKFGNYNVNFADIFEAELNAKNVPA